MIIIPPRGRAVIPPFALLTLSRNCYVSLLFDSSLRIGLNFGLKRRVMLFTKVWAEKPDVRRRRHRRFVSFPILLACGT